MLDRPLTLSMTRLLPRSRWTAHSQVPVNDIVGVTAILLTCSYKDSQEFLRVGYYVNVEYDNPELNENPPAQPIIERLHRHILAEKPRVTKFQIDWDDLP